MPIKPLINSSRTACISVLCGSVSRTGRNSRLASPFFMALSRIAVIRPDSDRQSALAPVQAMAAPRAASTPVIFWW